MTNACTDCGGYIDEQERTLCKPCVRRRAGDSGTRLALVPLTQRQATEACKRWHRHNAPPRGDVIRVGAAVGDQLVAVGIAGRPVARQLDNGQTLEVTRVASSGYDNATSFLYRALARAAFNLGYNRVITYTQAGEPGSSLRAAGYRVVAERPATKGWSRIARPRDDAKYMTVERTLWEVTA